jgi:hypothetical protein
MQRLLQVGSGIKNEIFAAIHLTAGLPGRGPEITSTKVYNTERVMRNLIIREGRLLVVIEYNKGRASNNHAFYIVRYLISNTQWNWHQFAFFRT